MGIVMFDFRSAFSRYGRLCIIFVYCWLSGQNWSCCYCCLPSLNSGSKTTTKSNVHYNLTTTPTLPKNSLTASPATTPTTASTTASTATDKSSFQPQIQTIANVHQQSIALSNQSDSQADVLIIIIPAVAFIILLIVGAILLQKKCQTRRKDKEASEMESDQQQQHTVDCDNLIQSTNSTRLDPEGECFFENSVAESPAIELQPISSPVYATLEFLPNNSIVEDYANTFRSVQFLNGDIFTTYAEINFKSSE